MFYPFHQLIGTTALNAILAGLLVNLLFVVVGATFFVWLTGKLTANPAIKTVTDEVIWIATFAYLGSLSSLLLKLENYAKERSYDPFLLFCTGVCKPFIGIFFGMFAYMILKSKFFAIAGMDAIALPLDPKDSMAAIKLLAMLAVVGFISGFSERFGPDLVARAESTLGAAAPEFLCFADLAPAIGLLPILLKNPS